MNREHYYEWERVSITDPDGNRVSIRVKFEVYDEDIYKAAIPCDFDNPDNFEWLTLTYIENQY